MNPLGLIAGKGQLPVIIASEAHSLGRRVVAIALDPIVDTVQGADIVERIHIGKLNEVIKTLKRHKISEAVMAGKISKGLLYGEKIRPDFRAGMLLLRLKDRGDDSIINAVRDEFEKDGIRIIGIPEICPKLLMPEGTLTKRKPSKQEKKDIEFGFRIAKEIGRLDIGQTVVIKNKAVMAVEAIEGTDEAIKRGGALAGGGAVVVKVIRPTQDIRFDMPVAGTDTIRVMIEAGAEVLALEAGTSLFIEQDECISMADEAGISIVGYRE